MNTIRAFSVAAGATLLVAIVAASGSVVRAQELNGGEAWGVPSNAGEGAAVPEKKTPVDVTGCWVGPVDDKGQGPGYVEFTFTQTSNGTKLVADESTFDFEFDNGAYAYNDVSMKGSVSGSKVSFNGTAGKGCSMKGSGVANSGVTEITGTYHFSGACNKKGGFKGGTFQVEHC